MNIYIPPHVFSLDKHDSIKIVHFDDHENYYVISGEFQKLWKLIDGKKNRQILLQEFALSLDLAPEEIQTEVFDFLNDLISMKLIEEY